MSEYQHVVRGKLVLKGGKAIRAPPAKMRQPASSAAHAGAGRPAKSHTPPVTIDDDEPVTKKARSTSPPPPLEPETTAPSSPVLTKAEREFEEAQARREEALIERKIARSHRANIEAYNAKLAAITEHNDLPKISGMA